MDIFTHATVGAFTGLAVHPSTAGAVVGAMAAISPDIPIWSRKRMEYPSELYYVTHSLTFMACMFPVLWALFDLSLVQVIILAWYSHIVLDAVSHGDAWAPRLMWPADMHRASPFGEWEWFNRSWWFGLFIAILWIIVCFHLSTDTGSPSSPSALSMVYRI